MIVAKDVSFKVKETVVLDKVNLDCKEGEICGIYGSNGSGKTMLMKCICGFKHPNAGEICVMGKKIGVERDFIPEAGVVVETPGFIPYYSGIKNLRLLASVKKVLTDRDIIKIMIRVGLDPDLPDDVKGYSLGMKQRLGFAQALMGDPKVLILDEIFSGLDPDGVRRIKEYIFDLKRAGKTILLSSHSKEEMRAICDRVYEMRSGKLEEI